MPTLDSFLNHPIETLEKALHIRKQIAALEEGLKSLFGPTPISLAGVQTTAPKKRGRPAKASLATTNEPGVGKKKRKMSAAAKAKIANAQRLRWAKSKGLESAALAGPLEAAPVTETKKKKKGKMSAAGRARIVAAQKARWAAVKGGTTKQSRLKSRPEKASSKL